MPLVRSSSATSSPRALTRAMLAIAAPVALARLGIMGMGIVDTILVGQLAPHELPFLALGWAPTAIFVVGGIGLLTGVQVLAARVIGEGRADAAGTVWRRGIALSVAFGAACTFALLLSAAPLLRLFGVRDELIGPAAHVAAILAWSIPVQFTFTASSFFLEAIQRPNAGTVVIWIANIVNLVLDLIWIPHWGAAGAAYATFASRTFMALAIAAYVYFSKPTQKHGVRCATPSAPNYRALLSVGVAAALSQVAEAGAFSGLTIIAGRISAEAVATYQILLQLLAVVFMVALGMSSATAVLVSDAYGRQHPHDVTRASWAGLKLNSAAMVLLGVVMFVFARAIARAFTGDAALEDALALLIPACALIPIFDGFQVVGAAALRARGDNWFPTASHFLAYVFVMPPLAFWLGELSGQGVHGLATAILTASTVSAGVLLIRILMLDRRARAPA
jgi:MATE family multidrug resistance protein